MKFQRLRGFADLTGEQARVLARLEDCAREIMRRYSVNEIRIPILERLDLYQRSTGETSDIVEKQMYTFADEDGTMVALRPEGTPGVVRAYVNAGLDRTQPEQRYFYSGPMFRRERPQKGRYRQFHQFGVEIFGRADAAVDAELMVMLDDLRRELKLVLEFQVNSLGHNAPWCRGRFREALLEFGHAHFDELCEDCKKRLERNPLRLLDCKIDAPRIAESAPSSLDYLCDDCRRHFDTVKEMLAAAGVAFTVNPRMVRGLDYYVRTAFEVVSGAVGAQSAVAAGGRYDGLVEALGGSAVAGIGFAIGLDRLAIALEAGDWSRAAADGRIDLAIAPLGETAGREAARLARELREHPLRVELLPSDRRLKALLAIADRSGARYAAIIGDNELGRGVVILRDLAASTQQEIPRDAVAAALLNSVRQ